MSPDAAGAVDGDELAALRRRAYGPDADIATDPGALARLRELEARPSPMVRPDESGPALPPPAAPAAEEARRRDRAARQAVPPRADESPVVPAGSGDPVAPNVRLRPVVVPRRAVGDAEPEPRRLGRRIRIAWAVSLAAAVVVSLGLAALVYPAGVGERPPAAVLTAQPGEAPDDMVFPFGPEARDGMTVTAYGAYVGIDVFRSENCIWASFGGDGTNLANGICGGRGLPPLFDVYVPPADADEDSFGGGIDYPAAATARYPDGATLRFSLRGDLIYVEEGGFPDVWR